MAIHENCHLIGILGGKGGVGKSVLAANLACATLSEMRAQTLLVDLDEKSAGDQNIILGLKPQKTVTDICSESIVINQQTIKSIVTPHQSGLHYLGAVHTPEEQLSANAEAFKNHISNLSKFYKYIFVDLGSTLGDVQLATIEMASLVLVVSTPDLLVVNQTRRVLNELFSATFPIEMFHIVLNRVMPGSITPQAIAQSLGRPILGTIPEDGKSAQTSLQRAMPFVISQKGSPISNSYHDIVRKLTGGVLQKLKSLNRPKGVQAKGAQKQLSSTSSSQTPSADESDNLTKLKIKIHKDLIKEMDLKKDLTNLKGDKSKELELRKKTQTTISMLLDRMGQNINRDERSKIIKTILDEALGLGALEELLSDSEVSEIMVNGHNKIFIERNGKLTLSGLKFSSNLQLKNVIERIVTPLGRRIDEKTPYVDARLKDGSRVNAVIEPLSIDGPSITIRKFAEEAITPDHYLNWNSMSKPMVDFLKICVEQGLNIVISGGTGSGKTTLLNVMSSFIPSTERIITVEDAAELQLQQEHVVRLETRPANMEGSGEVSIRDLIKNSLRMRPDRIIVGECRDGAALDMLSAMNTGHDGSMTTVHANSPREAVSRVETLCLMAGMDLPVKAIREQIAGAVNMFVQIGRLSDGSRKIKSITEVVGIQGDTITLQEIFRFKEEGFDKKRKIIGQFQPMGLIPTFIEKFEKRGVVIPRGLFTNTHPVAKVAAAPEKAAAAKTSTASVATKPTAARRPQSTLTRPKIKKASGES